MDASGFVLKVAQADMVCLNGLELEVGWLPKVLAKTGNAKIQPGGDGYCDLGGAVTVLDKPTGTVDRSMGDNPAGNPHYGLSPKALAEASTVVERTLSRLRPRTPPTSKGVRRPLPHAWTNCAARSP